MKNKYCQPQVVCTVVTMGQFLCDSPGGATDPGGGSHGGGNAAPARKLYV